MEKGKRNPLAFFAEGTFVEKHERNPLAFFIRGERRGSLLFLAEEAFVKNGKLGDPWRSGAV